MFYPRSVDIIKIVLHLWMKGSPFQHHLIVSRDEYSWGYFSLKLCFFQSFTHATL